MSDIDEIRKRHKEGDRANAVEDRGCLLDWVKRLRVDLEIERMRIREHQAEVERLRAERDTLLLDAREFVRWFNAHYPDPSSHPDHPWCVINDRLNAHADTLAALNAAAAKLDKEDRR